MFSYSQIARWVSFPADPISVEDWVANRDVFGETKSTSPEEKQLEMAYDIEMARAGGVVLPGEQADWPLEILLNGLEVKDVFEGREFVVVAPVGLVGAKNKMAVEVELKIGVESSRKVKVNGGDVLVVPVLPDQSVRVKVRCGGSLKVGGKNEVIWSGGGKSRLVVDVRGRPLPNFAPDQDQQEAITKLKQALSD